MAKIPKRDLKAEAKFSLMLKYVACNFFLTDPPASTPAIVTQDDIGEEDEDEEPSLNEDDDDDDLDDVDQGEELSTQHLVLAQFDKVLPYSWLLGATVWVRAAAYTGAFSVPSLPSNICFYFLAP